ncbi:MAG: hypothetical protein J5985_00915 [Kiritimatiellae bacterium]|nr:hypothetical protein [Kiritimatiellia bacterium]
MKKTMHSKISVRGQVSVPVDICRALGVNPGDLLSWSIAPGGAMAQVTRVQPPHPGGAKALLGYAGSFREQRPSDSWYPECPTRKKESK